ncbi:hypothetical protein N8D56_21190 [Devosia sp. A8/3-2]|nr:hypothetical protein N8D56_21190 [Devosia sp. A8/3-2]
MQEILRAQLRLWAYGLSAFVQSLSFYAAARLYLGESQDWQVVVSIFAGSYALGALASYALCRFPCVSLSDFKLLRKTIRTGTSLTFSQIAENGLYLGAGMCCCFLA